MKKIKNVGLIEDSKIKIEEPEPKNDLKDVEKKKIPKQKSLLERRLDLRKDHLFKLSNRRNIKSYTIVNLLSDEIESIILYQKNVEGFENMTLSDLVNLALADFVKNYT